MDDFANQNLVPVAGPSSKAPPMLEDKVELMTVSPKQWFPLREITRRNAYPKIVLGLLERQLEAANMAGRRFGALNIMITLSHVQLMESGFVPLVQGKPLRTADELMEMSMEDRMITLLNDLVKILEVEKNLGKVTYRCIGANQTGGQEPGGAIANSQPGVVGSATIGSNYKYLECDINHVFFKDANIMVASMSSSKGSKTARINFMDVLQLPLEAANKVVAMSLTPMEFVSKGKFSAEWFAHYLKHGYIYPVMDIYDDALSEDKGLMNLPDEMLVELCKHMGLKTLLNFSVVNKQAHRLLRHHEGVWKSKLMRINLDMDDYEPNFSKKNGSSTCEKTHETYEGTYKARFQTLMLQRPMRQFSRTKWISFV